MNTSKVKKPRIGELVAEYNAFNVQVLETPLKGKPRISSEIMAALRDNRRIACSLGHDPLIVNDLFAISKIKAMLTRQLCADHTWYLRDEYIKHIRFGIAENALSCNKRFRDRQRESQKLLLKAQKQTAPRMEAA